MEFSRRTAQLLHEDHVGTIALVEALEEVIRKAGRGMPDTSDPATRATLTKTAQMIEREIRAHFSFEEDELFTRLEEAGDVGIGAHLREEHAAILPLGTRVAEMAGAALESGFTEDAWKTFRGQAGELIEMMFAHIQKEEMALLPALDDLLDAETDMSLSETFEAAHD